MKKILSLALVLLFGTGLFAASFGFCGGLSWNSIKIEESSYDFGKVMGFQLGAAADIQITDMISIQPAGLFHFANGWEVSGNVVTTGAAYTETWTFSTIDLPVYAKIGFDVGPAKISVLGGPMISIVFGDVNQVIKSEGATQRGKGTASDAQMNVFNYGFSAGAEIKFSNYALGCFFNYMLSNLDSTDTVKMHPYSISPMISYYF